MLPLLDYGNITNSQAKKMKVSPVSYVPEKRGKHTVQAYVENVEINKNPLNSGVFNVKLIEYGNGLVEVRTYTEPVGRKAIAMTEQEMAIRQIVGRLENKPKMKVLYNPFTEEEEEMADIDNLEDIERRKERSVANSYKRTIQKLHELTRQCNWEYFITLTFSSECVDRQDFAECMKKANRWFNNQRLRYSAELQYMFVPELHADGVSWHIHGLIARVGDIALVDSGHKDNSGRIIYNMSGWRYGWSTATKVTDTNKVSGYVTKYITKDLCANTQGRRRYYRSQNIPEPVTHEFLVEGNAKESFAQILADSLGVALDYEKNIEGFVGVNYKYYKKSEVEKNE